MLNISVLQEKRSIVAYSMAGDKKHAGLENVWRRCLYTGKKILLLMVEFWREEQDIKPIFVEFCRNVFVESWYIAW